MKNKLFILLRKTEPYIKTDMVYLFSQSGWLIFGQVATFATSLLVAWLFANKISPSDYGLYRFVIATVTIASIFSISGISISLARAAAKNYNIDFIKLIRTQVSYGTIGATGVLLVSLYYFYVGNVLLGMMFLVSSIWIPLYESSTHYQYFLQGQKNFRLQTTYRISQRVLFTTIIVSTILFTKNIVLITFFYFAGYVLTHLFYYRLTAKKYPATHDEETPYNKILSEGKAISLQNIFFVGGSQLDKLLLFKFLGPAQLAIYLFATAIPNELQTVFGNINSIAFPKLVEKHSKEFKYALLRKIFLLVAAVSVPVFLYIFLAPVIFDFFFPAYTESVPFSQLYVLSVLFIPFNIIWSYFYAIHHEKALWVNALIVPSAFIIGIIIFVPFFGLIGALLAVYTRYLAETSLGLYYFLISKSNEER